MTKTIEPECMVIYRGAFEDVDPETPHWKKLLAELDTRGHRSLLRELAQSHLGQLWHYSELCEFLIEANDSTICDTLIANSLPLNEELRDSSLDDYRSSSVWHLRAFIADQEYESRVFPLVCSLALTDPNPNIRWAAVIALTRCERRDALAVLRKLVHDDARINFFDTNLPSGATVGQYAAEAIEEIEERIRNRIVSP